MFYALLILITGAIVALDQVTKALVTANIPIGGSVEAIPGFFHLTHIHNTGAAFSMLSGQRTFFLILTAVFLITVVFCVVKQVLQKPYLWILAIITGGAIGNLIDRICYGYVIDMIAVEFMNFAIFNVADIFVTCGAIALAIYALFFDRTEKKESKTHDRNL